MSVPALRFKEFNGEWAAKKLSDVALRIGDGLHSTPVYDASGDYYFVNGNNLTNNKIEINESTKRLSYKEYLKHKIELSSQSILMSINGTIGNLAFFNNEQVVLGKSACYINLKANENKHFVFNLLQTSNIKSYFDKELTGSTIKNLSLTTIKNTTAFFPCHKEQAKIANFLTSVDEKISLLTQKSDLLAQYKKGVMQKIFSQELRFKDDDGREFPEWAEQSLSELMSIPEKIKPSKIDKNKLLTVKLHLNGVLRNDNTDSLIIGATSYYVRRKGQFIYGKQNLFNGAFGIVPDKLDGYLSSGDVPALDINNEKLSPDYLIQFLGREVFYKDLEKIASGSGSKRIHETTFLEINILLPCMTEQTKIANFLCAIDDKITQTQAELAAVKQYKQGLLQQMFV